MKYLIFIDVIKLRIILQFVVPLYWDYIFFFILPGIFLKNPDKHKKGGYYAF